MLTNLLTNVSKPIIVGHRGSRPENKIQGFTNGVKSGSHMIECDVRLSKDGTAIVIHDEKIDRTTTGVGKVNSMNTIELKTYDIPSLNDIALWLLEPQQQDICLAVEIKKLNSSNENSKLVKQVTSVIHEHGIMNRSLIISFSKTIIMETKQLMPSIQTGLVYGPLFFNDPVNLSNTCYADQLWIHHKIVTEDVIQRAKQYGKAVFAWTVNNKDDVPRLIEIGVTGIVTDFPSMIIEQVNCNNNYYEKRKVYNA